MNSLPPHAAKAPTLNGKKIHVSKNATLSTSLLCTGFPARKRKASPNLQYYGDFTQRSHGVRRDGSAAFDLASVAARPLRGFWEFGLKPGMSPQACSWSKRPEAKSPTFGQPYRLGGPMILATNGLIHEETRSIAEEISQRDPNAPLRKET